MANLFAAAQSGPKPLVSFRAGKMFKEGNMVRPDKRKGQVTLIQQEGLVHFRWNDRNTGTFEEDLMVFPEEAKFYKVEKCTTGRVYVLDFHGTGKQLFYWLQEPKDDKDEENCANVNKFINNPALAQQQQEANSPPAAAPTATQQAALAALGGGAGMDRAQLMNLLAGMGGGRGLGGLGAALGAQQGGAGRGAAAPRPPVPAPVATQPAQPAAPAAGSRPQAQPAGLELDALQQILAAMGAAPAQGAPRPGAGAGRPQQAPRDDVNLRQVLDGADVQAAIRQDPQFYVEQLREHLPECPSDASQEQNLVENVLSPQFQQSVELFQAALSDPAAFQEIVHGFELQQAPQGSRIGANSFLDIVSRSNPPQQATQQAPQQTTQAPAQQPEQPKEDKMDEDKQ